MTHACLSHPSQMLGYAGRPGEAKISMVSDGSVWPTFFIGRA